VRSASPTGPESVDEVSIVPAGGRGGLILQVQWSRRRGIYRGQELTHVPVKRQRCPFRPIGFEIVRRYSRWPDALTQTRTNPPY